MFEPELQYEPMHSNARCASRSEKMASAYAHDAPVRCRWEDSDLQYGALVELLVFEPGKRVLVSACGGVRHVCQLVDVDDTLFPSMPWLTMASSRLRLG